MMRHGWRTVGICVALALGTLLLYAPVLDFSYITLDDPLYVVRNFHLTCAHGWQDFAWCFRNGEGGSWIPLVWLSYMVDYQLYGSSLGGFHASNVVLHTVDTVLLFLLLKRMTGAFWPSAMVAALFALHPTHVESVAWISERKDVLSTLFWLLTMWAYVNFAEKGGGRKYFLVLVLFALGLMAKPMLVTLPFVLLLLDWWPLNRIQNKSWRELILEKVPLIFMAVAFSILTVIVQKHSGAVTELASWPLMARIVNALMSYCFYIKKMLWPVRLCVIYPLRSRWPLQDLAAVVVFLAGVSVVAIRLRKRFPYLLTGWLWYLGTLVPVIGIIQVGAQGMADRYTYIPSVGLFVMACWGLRDLAQYLSTFSIVPVLRGIVPLITVAVCFTALAAYGLVAGNQLQYWHDGDPLFRHTIAIHPDNYFARSAYGIFLSDRGSIPQALVQLRKSVEIIPRFPTGHEFLGKTLLRSGDLEAATSELQLALKLDPRLVEAHEDLGTVLLSEHQLTNAEAEIAMTVRLQPDSPSAHCLMGKVLAAENRFDDAEEEVSRALRLDPRYPDAHYQLGVLFARRHETTAAMQQFNTAIELKPTDAEALNSLAWILATSLEANLRNGFQAVKLAKRACILTRNGDAGTIQTLAAACAETSDFDVAIAYAKEAHDLAASKGDASVAAKSLKMSENFRAHRAFYEE